MKTKKQIKKENRKKDKEWAQAVKLRDNNKCIICSDTVRLNAHHIIPREDKSFRWEIDNGLTLCPRHHRFSFSFSAHQSSFIFYKSILETKDKKEQLERLWKKYTEENLNKEII